MNQKLWMAVVMLTGLFSACSNNKNEENAGKTTQVDNSKVYSNSSMAPAFSIKDMNNNEVNLREIRGKKLFVNLWATWCPPCKREMPTIAQLYQSVDTNKVAFLMISLDDMYTKAKAFADTTQLRLPFFYPSDKLPILFNVETIPSTFIFNEKGEIIKRVEGSEDYNTDAYRSLFQ
jgi:thiol-disulfide isomerase/thioredoxin